MNTRLLSSANRRWLHLSRLTRLCVLITLGLLAAGVVAALGWPQLSSASLRIAAPNPINAAWEKARAAGSYHFTSDVVQKSVPVASITNVGRTSRTDSLYLEGQSDLRAQRLELTL